ncbi:MAG: (Fe-S)-binding protein [Syntrophales bacterium]|nr:(Fe-S)-binding protein [Syntrophales bacterium]
MVIIHSDIGLLDRAYGIVSSCDRCGTCLTVCPLFASDGVERTSARGKNVIVRAIAKGILKSEEEALKALEYCLLCRACVEVCPSQVQTDEAVIYARQYLTEKTGGTRIKYRLIGQWLGNRLSVKTTATLFSLLRRLRMNKLFPPGWLPDEYLAIVAGPAILGNKSDISDLSPRRMEKVAYFEGCGMKLFFPSVAHQTKRILASTSEKLKTPNNFCCGLPLLAHGMMADFIRLSEKNLAIFSDVDAVITDCASCGSTLKHLGRFLPTKEAEAFAQRVMDVSEYLVKVGYIPQSKDMGPLTFHDPCHLSRGQGIKWEPRKLLSAVGDYRDMEGSNICCGGAGSFHLDYPDTAQRLLEKKKLNIEATGAKMVVTSCPGCLIQLSKLSIPVCHICQVI